MLVRWISGWWEAERRLTEDSTSRHRLPVQPERDLGKDDCHDAGQIRLNDKIADFPFQMKISCHHHIFSCRGEKKWKQRGKERKKGRRCIINEAHVTFRQRSLAEIFRKVNTDAVFSPGNTEPMNFHTAALICRKTLQLFSITLYKYFLTVLKN